MGARQRAETRLWELRGLSIEFVSGWKLDSGRLVLAGYFFLVHNSGLAAASTIFPVAPIIGGLL